MDTKQYVDNLFKGYQETSALIDFKEELLTNLQDRIASLVEKGLSQKTAYEKATAELGDVSVLAQELSLKKKQEVLNDMYLSKKPVLSKTQAIGYVTASAIILFGVLMAFVTGMASGLSYAGSAVALPFVVFGGSMLLFLRITQETLTKNPIPFKRALIYAFASAFILFGIMSGIMFYFMDKTSMELGAGVNDFKMTALFSLITFTIPGGCVYAFLALTEKCREKDWVLKKKESKIASWIKE